jgi:hypothetical protein
MKKLKFFAAGLAVVFAVCSAFTSGRSHQISPNATQKWGVSSTLDGSYYILEQNVTGESPSPGTYSCNQSSNVCTVQLDPNDIVQRNGHQEVLTTKASPQEQGEFSSM